MLKKKCTKCGVLKKLSPAFFARNNKHSTGFSSACKVCLKKQRDASYPLIREDAIARAAAWRKNNRAKYNSNSLKWAKQNKNKHLVTTKRYDAAHPENVKGRQKKYRETHPGAIKAKNHRQRAVRLGAPGVFTEADVVAQLKRQKYRCFWCKNPLEKYHVDHVQPLSKGGTNDPSNIVASCSKCNLSKGATAPEVFRQRLAKEKTCRPSTSPVKTDTASRSVPPSPTSPSTPRAKSRGARLPPSRASLQPPFSGSRA